MGQIGQQGTAESQGMATDRAEKASFFGHMAFEQTSEWDKWASPAATWGKRVPAERTGSETPATELCWRNQSCWYSESRWVWPGWEQEAGPDLRASGGHYLDMEAANKNGTALEQGDLCDGWIHSSQLKCAVLKWADTSFCHQVKTV